MTRQTRTPWLSAAALSTAALALLTACGPQAEETDGAGPSGAETQVAAAEAGFTEGNHSAAPSAEGPRLGSFGIDLDNVDESVDPGDDFYRYVNGKWLKTFEIPADKTNYGSFTRLADEAEENVRDIIQDMAERGAPAGSVEQKVGDLFAAWMDVSTIEARGLEPARADLEAIANADSREALAAIMVDPALSILAPWGGGVTIDAKNPDRYVMSIGQSGLGLPDRDYYLQDAERFVQIREAYKAYAAKMFDLAGIAGGAEKAEGILALETAMAGVSWERAKRRNRDLTYNLMTLDELESYAPGFPWAPAMDTLGIPAEYREVVVRENDAIQALADIFADTPMETWKDYMTFHYLSANAQYLPEAFDQAAFGFYGKTLRGQPEQRERWKRGVSLVNGNLGEGVGKIYVERHFPPESKAQMEDLVENLRTAFGNRLDEGIDWMGAETKEEARAKLAAFTPKIGYPEEFETYEGLTIAPDDLYGNMKRRRVWGWEDNRSQLGEPIDKDEWFMNPQTVNAYYSSTRNEIVFPAAILQAPFFDPKADPAVNYGGIGAVIGHEMGHGFDDQGRKSDGTGALREWWTPEDEARFEELAGALGEQYGGYEPIEGNSLNPELTMGENIGDLGGLSLAYHAYKLSLNGEEAPVIDGMTGDQRFFMAWAQIWARLYREEELINRIKTDPHSPSEYRTNGIVRNMDAWYEAFNVEPGDDLYLPPEERVVIW